MATARGDLHGGSLTARSCHAPTEITLAGCQRPTSSGRARACEAADPPARAAVMQASSSRCARSKRRGAPPWRASAPRSRATPRPPAWRPRRCCRRCSRRRARAAGGSRRAALRAATAAATGRQTVRPQQLAGASGCVGPAGQRALPLRRPNRATRRQAPAAERGRTGAPRRRRCCACCAGPRRRRAASFGTSTSLMLGTSHGVQACTHLTCWVGGRAHVVMVLLITA